MVEKGLAKRDLEQIFSGFEKRQGEKFEGLEERVDLKLKDLEERVVNQFHIISKGLIDQIRLLAEGHAGIIERLNLMEKENERQHLETRCFMSQSIQTRETKETRQTINTFPKIFCCP